MWIPRIGLWALMLVLMALLSLLGLPIVAFLAWSSSWKPGTSVLGKPIWVFSPGWAYLWSNNEDGITGIPRSTPPIEPSFRQVFAYSALRNKVSNLRYWKLINPQLDSNLIRWTGNNTDLYLPLPTNRSTGQWSLAWQGVFAGFWYVWPGGRQFRIGWAIVPSDATKDLYDEHLNLRQMFCPFTIQLNRWSTV